MRSRFQLLIALLACIVLLGCQPQNHETNYVPEGQQATATISQIEDTILPTETPIMETVDIELPTETPSESGVLTTEQVQAKFEQVDCGEIFCQVPWPGLLQRPVALGNHSTIDLSYLYASTMDGVLDPHHGIEFLNPFGTPVLAAGDGKVIYAGEDIAEVFGPYPWFYGNVVILEHDEIPGISTDIFTLYGHLSEIDVEPGTMVRAGDILGRIGFSGWATGPHLHFEIRLGENDYFHTFNPILWFEPESSFDSGESGMVAGTIMNYHGYPIPDLPISLKRLAEDGSYESYYYFSTYTVSTTNPHPALQENFAFPDVPAGDYRLAFVAGRLYEVFFTLEPGSLGFIKFQIE